MDDPDLRDDPTEPPSRRDTAVAMAPPGVFNRIRMPSPGAALHDGGQMAETRPLIRIGNDTEDEDHSAPELALVGRRWSAAASTAALIDLAVARSGRPVRPAAPIVQLRWWHDRHAQYHGRLAGLPAPTILCLAVQLRDIPGVVAELTGDPIAQRPPAPLIVIAEEEVFPDLGAARGLLKALQDCGATVRMTGCGTRFFTLAEQDPLPVDQAVIGASLPLDRRIMPRLAEIARRCDTHLLADDTPAAVDAAGLAAFGLDLWRPNSRPWRMIAPVQAAPARAPIGTRTRSEWQPVALRDALTAQQSG